MCAPRSYTNMWDMLKFEEVLFWSILGLFAWKGKCKTTWCWASLKNNSCIFWVKQELGWWIQTSIKTLDFYPYFIFVYLILNYVCVLHVHAKLLIKLCFQTYHLSLIFEALKNTLLIRQYKYFVKVCQLCFHVFYKRLFIY